MQNELSKSIKRRLGALMVHCLKKFDETYPSEESSRYKNELKNAFNDVMRATNDELNDYEFTYRPLKISEKLSFTRTISDDIKCITFGFSEKKPYVTISGTAKVLNAIRAEFGCGITVKIDSNDKLYVVGLSDCVNSVVPMMDKYQNNKPEYMKWREDVFIAYLKQTYE